MQDLFRGLGAVMNFAFGFTEVGVLVGMCSLYGYGLITGSSNVSYQYVCFSDYLCYILKVALLV